MASAVEEKKEEKKTAEPEAPAAPEIKPTQFIVPACLVGIKYFKVDLTIYLWELRYAFAGVVACKFLVIMMLYLKAAANTEPGVVKETAKVGLEQKETTKTMTVAEYDKAQVMKSVQQAAFALCLTCGIHYKWGNPTPLLFQCIMTPIGLFEDNLFKIYMLGEKAEGKLTRPFKAPASPFAELMGADADGKKAEGETKAVTNGSAAPPAKSKKSKKAD